MILTITPNTALDKVIFVDDFQIGQTVRTNETVDGMGGKGAVTSWALGHLGVASTATGFCGGATGKHIEAMLTDKGAHTAFIHVAGETRLNYVIARRADGSQGTITTAGYSVEHKDIAALEERISNLLPQAKFMLCGGSMPVGMPPNWYAGIIHEARHHKVTILADVSGQYMEPTFGALPDIIKPNEHEAETLLGRSICTLDEAAEAARALQSRGIPAVIITMGHKGAAAATPAGAFIMPPVPVQAVNTAGAGDSFNAGLIMGLSAGQDWPIALKQATATATASVLTPATGAVRSEDVAKILPNVIVQLV